MEIVSSLVQVEREEGQDLNTSGVWKMLRGVRLKVNTSRRMTMDVEVDI